MLALASAGFAVGRGMALGLSQAQQGEIFIRGGRVVNADGSVDADVRIVGDVIAEIGANLRPGAGARVIDASGHLVMPGGVDPHTHLHPPFLDTLTTGSHAAAAGGITTIGTFAYPRSGEGVLEALSRFSQQVSSETIVDVFLHGAASPPFVQARDTVSALAESGQPSVKIFMAESGFSSHIPAVIALIEAARDAGVISLFHCEDADLLAAAARRLTTENRTAFTNYAQSRPVVAEMAATQQAAAWCESTGAPIYVVHLSSARALEVCRQARRRGLPLYVETRPVYLHLTEEKLTGPDAPLFVGMPPLRSDIDREVLWEGLADGSIDVLATDHAPWTRAQKLDPSLSINNVRAGMSDLDFMLPMFFSEGVRKRGLPVERFVATTSTNAARIFGLYPRKGIIQQGALADVVVWDPERTRAVRAEAHFSRADYSVYDGWQVTGWPAVTIRRGEIVHENGRAIGAPGSGQLLRRERWRRPAGPL